jgi:hypothetical protein
MTHKLEIEATLERSLRSQVKAPRLDGRFDAAVWSRIEAIEQRAPAMNIAAPISASARWLSIINVFGTATALALMVYFGAQALGGVELNVPKVAAPEISATTMKEISRVAVQFVTGASLLFGLMSTSLGRRLRSELKQFL